MIRHIVILAAGMFAVSVATTGYAGDATAGKQKAQVCASCHGPNGLSPTPNFPIIAGQYRDYIVRALKDYKSGARDNAIMKGFAANLSEQDMEDLAAWFSSQDGLAAPILH